jgi:hypothetical protein
LRTVERARSCAARTLDARALISGADGGAIPVPGERRRSAVELFTLLEAWPAHGRLEAKTSEATGRRHTAMSPRESPARSCCLVRAPPESSTPVGAARTGGDGRSFVTAAVAVSFDAVLVLALAASIRTTPLGRIRSCAAAPTVAVSWSSIPSLAARRPRRRSDRRPSAQRARRRPCPPIALGYPTLKCSADSTR